MPKFVAQMASLNPRFDGAFLNFYGEIRRHTIECLNPRFDGAFLNLSMGYCIRFIFVLIPDLMGLF